MARDFIPFMISTPELPHVTFRYAVCGHSVHMENLIRFNLREYWSTNESRHSFTAQAITGQKCIEGVTLH
jgi:hypothetical protein